MVKNTKNLTWKLGKSQRAMLNFLKKYIDYGWHSFSQDYDTKRVVKSLQKRGLIDVNKRTNQMRLKKKLKIKFNKSYV